MKEIADLHPSDFVKSETAMRGFKRKRWFGLLPAEALKAAHFDPKPLDSDLTISEYHKRISTQLPQDREKLHFSIPFESQLDKMIDKFDEIDRLQKDVAEVERKRQSDIAEVERKYQSDIAEVERKRQSDIAEVERNIAELERKHQSDIMALKKKVDEEKENNVNRFMLCLGNMLISLARYLARRYKPLIADDVCTTRLQQFAMSIEEKQLQEAGVPSKVWPFLRDIKAVCIPKSFLQLKY